MRECGWRPCGVAKRVSGLSVRGGRWTRVGREAGPMGGWGDAGSSLAGRGRERGRVDEEGGIQRGWEGCLVVFDSCRRRGCWIVIGER